jgi:hypothetical protein
MLRRTARPPYFFPRGDPPGEGVSRPVMGGRIGVPEINPKNQGIPARAATGTLTPGASPLAESAERTGPAGVRYRNCLNLMHLRLFKNTYSVIVVGDCLMPWKIKRRRDRRRDIIMIALFGVAAVITLVVMKTLT